MSLMTEMIEPLLSKADGALGAGYSAVLYGSAARAEHVPGISDINLLIVAERLDSATLLALEPPFSQWVSRGVPPPLLMTRAEWLRADDVFPVEITDMKSSYQVLRGVDPVSELTVRPTDLRRALEREFRGKLNRLRQAFVPSERDPESLGVIARQSIASVGALHRALLVLVGKNGSPGLRLVLQTAGEVVGFDSRALVDIVDHRADQKWKCRREDFEEYLKAVERTVTYVDELQLGDAE
jgi:predicted nucleotidyltransferase